jgi:hypothetical protein
MATICDECRNQHRLDAIELELSKNAEEHAEFKGHNTTALITNAVTNEKLEQILAFMKKLETRADKEDEQPKRRWEFIITSVIQAVVVIIIGYMFAGGGNG